MKAGKSSQSTRHERQAAGSREGGINIETMNTSSSQSTDKIQRKDLSKDKFQHLVDEAKAKEIEEGKNELAEEVKNFCSLRTHPQKELRTTMIAGLYYFHVGIVYKTMSSTSPYTNFELLQTFWTTFQEVYLNLSKYTFWQNKLFKHFPNQTWPTEYIEYRSDLVKNWKETFDKGYSTAKLPVEFNYPISATPYEVQVAYFGYRVKDHGDRMKNILNNYLGKYYLEFEESIKFPSVLFFAIRKKYYTWKSEKKIDETLRRKKRMKGKAIANRKKSTINLTNPENDEEEDNNNNNNTSTQDVFPMSLDKSTTDINNNNDSIIEINLEEEEKEQENYRETKMKESMEQWEGYQGKWFPQEWLTFILLGKPADETALNSFKAEFKAKMMHNHTSSSESVGSSEEQIDRLFPEVTDTSATTTTPIRPMTSSLSVKEDRTNVMVLTDNKGKEKDKNTMIVEQIYSNMKEDITYLKEAANAAESKKRLYEELKDNNNTLKVTNELIEIYDMIQKKARSLVKI